MFESFFKKETPKDIKARNRRLPYTFPKEHLLKETRKPVGNLGIDDGMKGYHSSTVEPMSELLAPTGLNIFNKMKKNDPIVGGLILLLESVIKRMEWSLSGDNAKPVKELIEMMDYSISSLLNDISSTFTFGFYLGEKIWILRNGVMILKDIEPRYQPTLQAINDEKGLVIQQTSGSQYYIPYEKTLHITFISDNRSPFGVSLLRHLYKPYYYKLSIEAAEALSIDRDLGGLPVMKAPEGFDFTAADSSSPNYDPNVAATLEWAIQLVSSVRRDQQQGIVIPNGWEFSITRGENRASVPTSDIIARYNTEMAVGVLANFLSLGAFATTNNANVGVHVTNFLGACEAYAKAISDAIQRQVINKLCQYNRIEKAPVFRLCVKNYNPLKDVGTFISGLIAQGAIHPTPSLERMVLELTNLPYDEEEVKEAIEEAEEKAEKMAKQQINNKGDKNAQRSQDSDDSE